MIFLIRWLLTGGGIPFLILLSGGFFFVYLRGYPFRNRRFLSALFSGKDKKSSGKAMLLALAGTLGVGNIVGVANAISVGGAGAVFWIWVSSLFAMILKYAEILLAVRHRRGVRNAYYGGSIYYMEDYFFRRGRVFLSKCLPILFALLIILDAVTMGSMIQVNAITSSIFDSFGIPPFAMGILVLFLSVPLIIKGTKEISGLTFFLVPLMSVGFILLSLVAIFLRADRLGEVFSEIFRGAFQGKSAIGGVSGFLFSDAVRVGTMRGLLSNEAGCGTATAAHATADTDSPAKQGVFGIFEVFADSILLCTLTAMVILLALPECEIGESNGAILTLFAYSSILGGYAGKFLSIAIFFFGYATILCWANYGSESVCYLTRKRGWKTAYILFFSVSILIGSVILPEMIWDISDFAITGLALLNLPVLFFMRHEILDETESAFGSVSK